jgi:hypothetical protein
MQKPLVAVEKPSHFIVTMTKNDDIGTRNDITDPKNAPSKRKVSKGGGNEQKTRKKAAKAEKKRRIIEKENTGEPVPTDNDNDDDNDNNKNMDDQGQGFKNSPGTRTGRH